MRASPHVVLRRFVQNQSARSAGARPALIVIHSTEGHNVKGVADLQALGALFDRPSSKASSHVAIDDEGQSARFVRDERKAWTCAGFNSVSLNIEQVGVAAGAAWTREEYRECARWVARWSLLYGIPIRSGRVSGRQVTRSGVVRHSDLGAVGGGHSDPGKGYRMTLMLTLARAYAVRLRAVGR